MGKNYANPHSTDHVAITPLLTYSFLLRNREYKGKLKTVAVLVYMKIVTFMTILANGVTVSSNKC